MTPLPNRQLQHHWVIPMDQLPRKIRKSLHPLESQSSGWICQTRSWPVPSSCRCQRSSEAEGARQDPAWDWQLQLPPPGFCAAAQWSILQEVFQTFFHVQHTDLHEKGGVRRPILLWAFLSPLFVHWSPDCRGAVEPWIAAASLYSAVD